LVIVARRDIVIDQSPRWGGIQTQLGDAETGGQRAKRRNRNGEGFGIRQVELNALNDFRESQVTYSIIGDDMH
jgi:hypothetical protein